MVAANPYTGHTFQLLDLPPGESDEVRGCDPVPAASEWEVSPHLPSPTIRPATLRAARMGPVTRKASEKILSLEELKNWLKLFEEYLLKQHAN